jgi:regulator of protease activity HflC (stomatin/prohibitin superfamily)
MAPPRPSFGQVLRAIAAAALGRLRRASTRGLLRLALLAAIVALLGVLGPAFIALPIFDRPTSAASSEATCVYDAEPGRESVKPQAVVAGQPISLELLVVNSGTCAWDARVTLRREGGNLTAAPQSAAAGEIGAQAPLQVGLPFTAPLEIGVYSAIYRLRTPDDRAFGAPLTASILTYPAGGAPVYPADPPITAGKLVTFLALALPGAIGLYLALDHTGRFVRAFYGLKHDAHGRAFLRRRLFHLGAGASALIRDGEFKFEPREEALDKIGGPGTLSVHMGMAALLERGGVFSRIVGPGKIELSPFERVRAIVDLRRQSRSKTETAYTKDGIEVKAEATVSFWLMPRKDGEEIAPPQAKPSWWEMLRAWLGRPPRPARPVDGLPASPDAIRSFVYDWPAGVAWDATVSSGLSDLIPQKMLDELWAPDDLDRNPRREWVEELLNKAKEKQRKNGIEVIDLSVGPLDVPEAVARQRREYWSAAWDKLSRLTTAEGEAEALRQRQAARADAQAELIQTIAQSFRMMAAAGMAQPSREVAIKLLEVIARTMRMTLGGPSAALTPPPSVALLALDRLRGTLEE